MSHNKFILKYEDLADQISSVLAHETIKLLKAQFPKESDYRLITQIFLSKYTAQIVYETLSEAAPPDCTDLNKRYELTADKFKTVKASVQDAVSAAFSGAMRKFSGKEVDYFCQIKTVPPVANKEPI